MRILVTGALGMLGQDVMEEAVRRGHETAGTYLRHREEVDARLFRMDITDPEAVRKAVAEFRPDAVIHCAAWTDVDAAEEAENRETVSRVNCLGALHVARAAREAGAKMVYVSTDYVFDGSGTMPWEADCRKFGPLNHYGRSKLDGERAVRSVMDRYFIVRTSWVFGRGGKNFVRTMIRAGRTHDAVRVVSDQTGTPTYTRDLARLLTDMAESGRYGVYHATNSETEPGGYISWYDFCREIYRQAGVNAAVMPVSTEEYGLSRAVRPRNSRLDKSGLTLNGFAPLPDWKDALKRYLAETDAS